MAFEDAVARASIILQAQLDERQIEAAATRAAQTFDRQFARVQGRFASRAQQGAAAEAIGKAFGGIARNITFATKEVGKFQSAFAGFNKITGQLAGIAQGFALVAAVVGGAAIAITKNFAQTAGAFQELRQSIDAIIANSATANTTTEEFIGSLRRLAIQSGRSSATLANTGRQFLALGFSGAKTIQVLEAFAKGAALTGASSRQLELALNGVAQIASKGTVSMEELRRQIAENLPGAVNLARFFEILGEQLGITTAEARKLQEQGKITAEQGIPALIATVNEATEGTNVFALRLNTLSGSIEVIREILTQAVQDGFQPFIEALLGTEEAAKPLRTLVQSLSEGIGKASGPLAGLTGLIRRLAEVMGESLGKVLEEVVPLLPQVAALFVTLVEVIAPIVVEFVKMGAAIGRILLPVLNVLGAVLNVLVNRLGPVSVLLRAIGTGLLAGGVIRAFGLFGRAVGSAGGLLGRIATPLTKVFSALAEGARIVGIVTAAFDLFINTIGRLIGAIPGVDKLGDAIDFIGKKIGGLFGGGDENKPAKKIKGIEDAAKKASEVVSISFEDVNKTLTTLNDNLDKIADAQKDVTDASKALASANETLGEATRKLRDLEKERSTLLADTARDVREVAEAEEKLTRIRFTLRDLDQEEAEIQEKLNELRSPASAEELADADRDIERAKLALNKALREEAALQAGLTKQQRASVNLAGLTLDQIRAKLANIRATNAAQKETEDSEETLEEKQTEARLNVADAQANLNKALEERTELDNRVRNNAIAIRELEEKLTTLSIDRAAALRDESVAQAELNRLRAGDTERAKELKKIDEEIRDAKRDQAIAAADVRDKEEEVNVKKREQRIIVAEIKGDESEINRLLLERIGLNRDLIAQNPALLQGTVDQLVAQIFTGLGGEAFGFTQGDVANPIANALLNNPNALRDILRRFGLPLAEGGLITQPTFAQVGERFKHEMVLPLTKPDRVWQLLSQHLPRYPGALAAAQAAVRPASGPAIKLPTSGMAMKRGSGPMTWDQADEIIRLLKENGQAQITVEAPVTVSSPVQDPDLLARKLARQVLRGLE